MTKICILAGNYSEALAFAKLQNIPRGCWFFPNDIKDLIHNQNFYTIVTGTAGQNVPSAFFERIYKIALERGAIGRDGRL